ncbi:MAG: hypothetical protein CMK59_15640 [Proteobacteria bacterium]|nr:hypothetical protein [Pseudomonadota bacterium]
MSQLLYQKHQEGVYRLIIKSGRGNPLTPQFLEDLNELLDGLAQAPPKALILDADGSSIFSGGFALPIIASWEREPLRNFLNRFLDAVHKIIMLPCPTITALEGSAVAGGFILSLASDFRMVSNNPKIKLGLPEVDLGAALPSSARVLMEHRTSMTKALYYSMTAKLFGAQEALNIGYALNIGENPLEDALNLGVQLAKKPGIGVGATKQLKGMLLVKAMIEAETLGMDLFLDSWFHPAAQQSIQAQAKRLSK